MGRAAAAAEGVRCLLVSLRGPSSPEPGPPLSTSPLPSTPPSSLAGLPPPHTLPLVPSIRTGAARRRRVPWPAACDAGPESKGWALCPRPAVDLGIGASGGASRVLKLLGALRPPSALASTPARPRRARPRSRGARGVSPEAGGGGGNRPRAASRRLFLGVGRPRRGPCLGGGSARAARRGGGGRLGPGRGGGARGEEQDRRGKGGGPGPRGRAGLARRTGRAEWYRAVAGPG